MTGVIDERGRLPGRMKFMGEGTYPNAFVTFGMEKSFISLFKMMPIGWLATIQMFKGETNLFQVQVLEIQIGGLLSRSE